jgi:hypothetical protein
MLNSCFLKHLNLNGQNTKKLKGTLFLKMFKSLEKDIRIQRLLKDDSADFEQDKIEDSKAQLLSQLDVIDDLLLNYGAYIDTDNQVMILVFKQRKDNKKPFGDASKDQKDIYTYIISFNLSNLQNARN